MSELLAVLVAAAAAWGLGAVYYMALAKPWIQASGIKVDAEGKPLNASAMPFLLSALCLLVVAGMTRHIFHMAAIHELGKGLLSGLGIGAFFVAPWMLINNTYENRPLMLTVINAGYALIACGVIGAVLGMMA